MFNLQLVNGQDMIITDQKQVVLEEVGGLNRDQVIVI